ncbi:SDR family oxidoreductase [Massilia sp. P8910]|uniref:SDR family oxidoreductase n=1 Tax=Massilia antarctica TaxID=2765360 RepID=UPI0006BB8F5B|nr:MULTISPECIES: SDR family oxidoreductase [Massilia]MCE3608195.1 SDR family oxidoreductase [Massilia antarctica]MCY0910147.1 SDR family oxidoreductase [Massilia sp. H27-R4]
MPSTPIPSPYQQVQASLRATRHHWLITGVAGFVGSNLLEMLLQLGQRVTGLDNLMTGYRANLAQVRALVPAAAWAGFDFIESDIRCLDSCRRACKGVDIVLHQAALGSVGRSIADPILTSDVNLIGFLNMLVAARDAGVRRVVYAASSATYGDHPGLPKVEDHIGRPLSPYALTKHVNEVYAEMFARCYATDAIGLRYFNVFGPRQDPRGEYAAVIPQWFDAMIHNRPLRINGDGDSSRDFCFVDNAVQANLLAGMVDDPAAVNQVYNVAVNARTSLNELFAMMRALLAERFPHMAHYRPEYGAFRVGDVRHSQADISKAARLLGYQPTHRLEDGLREALEWYIAHTGAPQA